jgi:hypothetical protein
LFQGGKFASHSGGVDNTLLCCRGKQLWGEGRRRRKEEGGSAKDVQTSKIRRRYWTRNSSKDKIR